MSVTPSPASHDPVQDEWAQWIGATPAPADPDAVHPDAAHPHVVDAELAFGADDIIADQLSDLGAVGNSSDGSWGTGGTLDADWTG